jgi:dolichol-phosphate mannosyltransferase
MESLETRTLSVIVPVYNEGERIVSNLDLLLSEVEPHFKRFEVLVISDGSTDSTNSRLKSLADPRIKVTTLESNRGKGFAVRRGFQEAKGDYVLFIDGGMELHPKEIRIFIGLMDLYEADVVIGSKRHPQSNVDYPRIRRLLSSIYQEVIFRLFRLDVTDTQVGLKLFRGEVIRKVLPHLEVDRYGFDLELLALARHFGFKKMLEAPITLDYFSRNTRGKIEELVHVFRVGLLVLSDTWRVVKKVKHLDQAGK